MDDKEAKKNARKYDRLWEDFKVKLKKGLKEKDPNKRIRIVKKPKI